MSATASEHAVLLVDRFVSASSATDAHNSLQALWEGLKNRNEEERIPAEIIWQDPALLEALLQVLTTSSYKDNVPLEEGPSLVCRIYQQLWKQDGAASVLLKEPSPGRLMQSLLDIVSDTEATDYTRVLGLQILNDVCTKAPSVAQTQLLEIPNGLFRLAGIFREDNDQVRNELLGGASQKIAKWPSCAKNWVFSEVCDMLMNIAMQEGGLTRGNVLVADCLMLVESLVDPTLADLIWESPDVTPKLAALLDLRGGTEFLNPPKPQVSQTDDLDDILATGNKKQQTEQVLPKLTFNEEDVIVKVLNILGVLLENPASRPRIWKQHAPLCSLVWELGLVTPPPPNAKPVCALPSARLQQLALESTAQYFHDYDYMKEHGGTDRLLRLVCTGNNVTKWDEKLGLSQAALHVLRQTLPEGEARDILTHTLAPPMMTTNDDQPPSPTVVQKLLNTVLENMNMEETTDEKQLERCRINLLGALGALSVFFHSSTDREVLLGITSSANLVDAILQCLEHQKDEMICLALLRFVCEWVVEAPTVVQAFLASTQSVVLSVLLGTRKDTSVGIMVGYLLGLFMEYMTNEEEKHGGWNKQSIMKLLSKRKGGISGYTTDLEKLKTMDLPWKACTLEWQRFLRWYSAEVLAIRRCVVHELTSGGDAEEGEDGDETERSSASVKSLNRLVSQQAKELEELRVSLSEAKATIESQEGQLSVWKRRVESTPTQLDEMLSEYTSKSADLEKEVSFLKKEMETKEGSIQSLLNDRDGQIVRLETTVGESQAREQESRQELDDLRGELQGLTSAYATLEQEYNRREGPSMHGTSAAAPTGETSDARPAQQPEGEVSHQEQSSNPELAALRSENARLRSDAQAADEWMAMAVQRMNDIGGQNQALQQEVTTLQGQLQQAQLTGGIVAPVVTGITQEQLDEERRRCEQFEQRLVEAGNVNSKLESDIEDLKRRLAAEVSRGQDLDSQLQSSRTDTTAAMDSLGGSKSEKESLERMVSQMEEKLRSARSEIAALQDERDRYEQKVKESINLAAVVDEKDSRLASKDSELESMRSLVASKDNELVGLRQQLVESREGVDSGLDSNSQELSSLRDNVHALSEELEKTRSELEETVKREREEIQRRDDRIRQLESSQSLQQSRDVSASGGVDNRDEEIKSLREANDAAQEWMAKAVEHHQMLSDQVAALTDDKAALVKEIKELQQSASVATPSLAGASRETIDQLERELSERTTEVTDLGARIIKLESEVRIKETEMAGVQEKIDRCDQLQSEVNSLEEARDADLGKLRSLEERVAQVVAEKERVSGELESIRQELNEKNELGAVAVDASSDETEKLKELLRQRETAIDSLRDELENAKDAFADADQMRITLQNARDENSRLRVELDETKTLLSSLKEKTSSFDQLQEELRTLQEASSQPDTERTVKESSSFETERLRCDLESLAVERDRLRENVTQLESQLSEFQTWADAAQLKITELQNEKDVLEQQGKLIASPEEYSDKAVAGALRDDLASLTTERDTLKEKVSEQETRLSEFQSWSEAAQLKIAELQNEKEVSDQQVEKATESDPRIEPAAVEAMRHDIASLKDKLADVIAERDTLKEKAIEMESQLTEFQTWSDAAQRKIAELEEEKEAVEQDMKRQTQSALTDDVRDEIAGSGNELNAVMTERDTLKDNINALEARLSELQSRSDAAERKIAELQGEDDCHQQEMKALVESEKEAREQLHSLHEEIELKSAELSSALEKNDELKAARADLDSLLEKTKLECSNLYGKNSSLEQDLKVLEAQCTDLIERSNQAAAVVKEKEDAVRDAEASAVELQSALEAIQEQSADVVDEWKAQVEELESTVSELEGALQQQQAEASDAVEQWSTRWSELEALKSDLERQLETISKERDDLSDMLQFERENSGKEALGRMETELRSKQSDWDAERERMQAQIDEQNDSLAQSLQEAETTRDELTQMRMTAEETVDAWKLRVSELENTVQELEQELTQRRGEAAEAISQWESHCSIVEARAEELEREMEAVSKEKDEAKLSMERSIEPLAEQLEEERAARARLEKENDSVIQQMEDIKAQSEDVVNQWKEMVLELESTVAELEKQLEEQQEEATKAIAQWETSYNALEKRSIELEEDLARVSREVDGSINEEVHSRHGEILSLRAQIVNLQEDLVGYAASQERTRELESALENEREALKEMQRSFESKRELAQSLETELLQLRVEVESDAAETRSALAVERAAREVAEKDLMQLQETVSETEEAFVDLCSKEEQILSESSQTKQVSDRMRRLLKAKEAQWTEEKNVLVQERDDLRATVGELQEELRDASDALQACVTDEVSEKATEVASQALRYQMERLRFQMESDQEAFARERRARLAAEEKVEALNHDLANVLGVIDDNEDASARLQRVTMRATETMQRREREEIEEVRRALERALQELSSAQAAEQKASEDAASCRLQLSICEQEVLAAKSDLAFLTQTLEETREAEASKAASLEYRISSLEDDREVLRQFHQDELENLRNEMTHISMEKDRILHSLKESEKKNAALVFSTAKTRESDGSVSPETELSRLRVEKAQLLTAAAEEGSRTEGRIREAVAAHVASMEADVILERELRVAAEAAVEDIKFQMSQMEELKTTLAVEHNDESREPTVGGVNDSRSESILDELSSELKHFKEETRALSAENESLRQELAAANEKSQVEVADLTDKWRMAQAKIHMLESSNQFDAEVNVEVAKLRSNGGEQEPRHWIVVHDNPVDDDGQGISPVETYDLIQKQKIAIQEERAMYLELLAEHDDLLALLAQQDLEKASLNAALSRVAGQEAVDAALADAEENAVKQFGKYVKVTS